MAHAFQALIQTEANRPDPSNVALYDAWKRKVEDLRRLLRSNAKAVLERARLAAMTTTRAVFDSENLRSAAPFDLVVFDEASQVSLPHAIGLAPLGRAVMFAGDPKQLAPIVQSTSKHAVKWMGNSPFEYIHNDSSRCFLNEQSRMAEPICRAVSQTFYHGKLVVAAKESADPDWHAERGLRDVPGIGKQALTIVDVPENGRWSRRFGGPLRKWSADRVVEIVAALIKAGDEDVVVLVPFRAQRSLIKTGLKNVGLNRIKVSTVHRAQGSQNHTIEFDPVDGASNFMLDVTIGERLINVAISRAKARVVLLLSAGDRENDSLDCVARIAGSPRADCGDAVGDDPARRLAAAPDAIVRTNMPTGHTVSHGLVQKKSVATAAGSGARGLSIPVARRVSVNPPLADPMKVLWSVMYMDRAGDLLPYCPAYVGLPYGEGRRVIAELAAKFPTERFVLNQTRDDHSTSSGRSPASQPGAVTGVRAADAAERMHRFQTEIDHLRAENEHLARSNDLRLKISDKGALSVYGLGRFPVTLYSDQWLRLLDNREAILTFMRTHPGLKTKN
jgi:hypothetical protein